jgi:hypothetical protein
LAVVDNGCANWKDVPEKEGGQVALMELLGVRSVSKKHDSGAPVKEIGGLKPSGIGYSTRVKGSYVKPPVIDSGVPLRTVEAFEKT